MTNTETSMKQGKAAEWIRLFAWDAIENQMCALKEGADWEVLTLSAIVDEVLFHAEVADAYKGGYGCSKQLATAIRKQGFVRRVLKEVLS